MRVPDATASSVAAEVFSPSSAALPCIPACNHSNCITWPTTAPVTSAVLRTHSPKHLGTMWHTSNRSGPHLFMICVTQGRQIPGLQDLGGLYVDAVGEWESYGRHDLTSVYWVGYVLHRSRTTRHTYRYRIYIDLDDLYDLCDLYDLYFNLSEVCNVVSEGPSAFHERFCDPCIAKQKKTDEGDTVERLVMGERAAVGVSITVLRVCGTCSFLHCRSASSSIPYPSSRTASCGQCRKQVNFVGRFSFFF